MQEHQRDFITLYSQGTQWIASIHATCIIQMSKQAKSGNLENNSFVFQDCLQAIKTLL